MATQIPREVYPFSTDDGKAIPLEVIKPLDTVRLSIANNALDSFTFEEEDVVAVFYSEVDAFVFFNNTTFSLPLVDGTRYTDALFIPANTLVTVGIIPGIAKVFSSVDSGYFYIQIIEKWAAMARRTDAIRR